MDIVPVLWPALRCSVNHDQLFYLELCNANAHENISIRLKLVNCRK